MAAEVLDRVTTPRGELVLRRADGHLEVISNGVFLMDTRDGRSERLLVTAATGRHPDPRTVLIGGLGVGFSLVEAGARDPLRANTPLQPRPARGGRHDGPPGARPGPPPAPPPGGGG